MKILLLGEMMNENNFIVPRITNVGLYDFKLRHGSVAMSDRRYVRAYELELPVYDGGYSCINECEYPIEADRVICAKPGQWRKTKPPFNCLYVHIIPDKSEICRILHELPDTIKIKNKDKIYKLFNDIVKEYAKSAHHVSLSLYGKFMILLDKLKNEVENTMHIPKQQKEANIEAVQAAVNFIDKNYMHKLTLETVATKVYLSPIYFRKLFYDVLGMTPYDYITDKRIEKAKQLLSATDMPLSEISGQCGFSEQAYFGKVFKAATGYTPRKYRISINKLYP